MSRSIWKLLHDAADHDRRARLEEQIGRLIAKWQPILGVRVRAWGLRTMKLYWASTNPATKRITFNTRLADVPPRYLEITIVHELVHLRAPGHTDTFYELMNKHVPGWRRLDDKYAGKMTPQS